MIGKRRPRNFLFCCFLLSWISVAWADAIEPLAQVDEAKEEEQIRQDATSRGEDPRLALAKLWANRGVSAYRQSQYLQAISYFERVLAIRREVGDRAGEGTTLNNLGEVYRQLSQYAKAIEYYEQALAIRREVQDRAGEGTTLNSLGSAYWSLSQYAKAIEYYEQALTIRREVQDRAGEGTTLSNLGRAYSSLSQSAKAIEYYEQALAIMREVQHRAGEGRTLSNLGSAYSSLSQSAKAIKYYEQALAIAREVQDRAGEGTTLNNLGDAYQSLSQCAKAIEYYEQALAIHREIKNRAMEGTTLNNLGAAYRSLSQSAKAIKYYEQALAIMREVQHRAGEGTTLNNLGLAYQSLSQYAKAIEYYEQALAIRREVGDRAGESITLNNLGAAYQPLSQSAKVIEYYEQALAIMREVQHRAGEGTTLNNLGEVYRWLSQYPKAIEYYEQALAISREVGDRAGAGTTLNNMMFVWRHQAKPALAIFYGKQAVNIYQATRNEIRGLGKELQQSFLKSKEDTYRYLADLLIKEGRLSEAQQVLNLLKEEEYFDYVRRDAQEASSLQGRATLTPEEAEAERRYNEIADRITAFGKEKGELLAKLAKRTPTPQEQQRLDKLDADLEVASTKFHQVLKQLDVTLGQSPRGKGSEVKVSDIEDALGMQSALGELEAGTVVLYTVVTDERYAVIVITPDTQVAREYPIAAADLNHKVFQFREALRNPGVDPRPLAQELYKILVAPIAKDLAGAGAQTLMWSLDGVLRYVPIAALHDGEHYVIERYRTVVFTPASKTELKDKPKAQWTGLGVGVSRAHEGFDALPGVTAELRGIIREQQSDTQDGIVPGQVLLDDSFTAQSLRTALRQRDPLVHIASHFHLRPGNETESFLLLGDGSHLPLSQLKTWDNVFAGVELLTLSVCDSAMGGAGANGKEVEGFGVMAQRQGAKAVVGSLWPVADESTKELMQTFYRVRQAKKGTSKAEALRHAQLALLRGKTGDGASTSTRGASANPLKDRAAPPDTEPAVPTFQRNEAATYAHPYYWAPFILIGNWL
jgi:CHAT domain-containing protein/Tfp pilus assembly protein PilF